ncbi:MAG: CDP-alcohol phosphatidyltransferase family protein [Clostridia bacterium]|nr:CDP-alcohol phosphatidyltransferase family protein [Clostridia bacterium]
MKHIPNILSVFRIALAGLFIYLFIRYEYTYALIVFATAFFTDILDGYLARKFNWISDTGKLLDPVADKLLVVGALICILIRKSGEPFYLVVFVLVVVKEALMLAGAAIMLKKKDVAYADWYGKSATGLFAMGIVLTLLDFAIAGVRLEAWCIGFLSAAVALSYLALIHYAKSQMFADKSEHEATDGTANEAIDEKSEK